VCVETREIGRSLRRPNATRARSPRPPLTAQLLEPTATELKALREAGLVPFALEPGSELFATITPLVRHDEEEFRGAEQLVGEQPLDSDLMASMNA